MINKSNLLYVLKFYFYRLISLFSKIAVKLGSLEDRRHVPRESLLMFRQYVDGINYYVLIIIITWIKRELERRCWFFSGAASLAMENGNKNDMITQERKNESPWPIVNRWKCSPLVCDWPAQYIMLTCLIYAAVQSRAPTLVWIVFASLKNLGFVSLVGVLK